MTAPAGRVLVSCASCDLGLVVPTSPATRLREFLGTFFADHDECDTSIDVSGAGGLRLLPARELVDHSFG